MGFILLRSVLSFSHLLCLVFLFGFFVLYYIADSFLSGCELESENENCTYIYLVEKCLDEIFVPTSRQI